MDTVTAIQQLLGVTEAQAYQIWDQMELDGFDFSESTERQYKKAIREAAAELGIS